MFLERKRLKSFGLYLSLFIYEWFMVRRNCFKNENKRKTHVKYANVRNVFISSWKLLIASIAIFLISSPKLFIVLLHFHTVCISKSIMFLVQILKLNSLLAGCGGFYLNISCTMCINRHSKPIRFNQRVEFISHLCHQDEIYFLPKKVNWMNGNHLCDSVFYLINILRKLENSATFSPLLLLPSLLEFRYIGTQFSHGIIFFGTRENSNHRFCNEKKRI